MRKLLRNIGLAGLLAFSSLSTGCFGDKCSKATREEHNILNKELSFEISKNKRLYGDINKDGIITEKEVHQLYGAVAKNNGGLFYEDIWLSNAFEDKNGDRLNYFDFDAEGCRLNNEELRTLITWFKEYKPNK